MESPSGDSPYDMGYTLFSALIAARMLDGVGEDSDFSILQVIHAALDDLQAVNSVLWGAMKLDEEVRKQEKSAL